MNSLRPSLAKVVVGFVCVIGGEGCLLELHSLSVTGQVHPHSPLRFPVIIPRSTLIVPRSCTRNVPVHFGQNRTVRISRQLAEDAGFKNGQKINLIPLSTLSTPTSEEPGRPDLWKWTLTISDDPAEIIGLPIEVFKQNQQAVGFAIIGLSEAGATLTLEAIKHPRPNRRRLAPLGQLPMPAGRPSLCGVPSHLLDPHHSPLNS